MYRDPNPPPWLVPSSPARRKGLRYLPLIFIFLITERAYRIARLHFNNKNSLKNISIQFQIIDK